MIPKQKHNINIGSLKLNEAIAQYMQYYRIEIRPSLIVWQYTIRHDTTTLSAIPTTTIICHQINYQLCIRRDTDLWGLNLHFVDK